MRKPRLVYKITSFSKRGKYTKSGWGYINEDTDTLVLNTGKDEKGNLKFLAFDKCHERFPKKYGTADQYSGIYTDYIDVDVEVVDRKYKNQSKGYESVTTERNTYVWFKKLK